MNTVDTLTNEQLIELLKSTKERKRDTDRAFYELEKEYKRHKVESHYGNKWLDQLLVVTPIAMEVAGDLIPLVEGENGGLNNTLQRLIDEMRKRILGNYGVKIPGIRFRGNQADLPNGTYIIMINEIYILSLVDNRMYIYRWIQITVMCSFQQ